jgi:hypothetical protein
MDLHFDAALGVVPHFAIFLQLACVGADGNASVPTYQAVFDTAQLTVRACVRRHLWSGFRTLPAFGDYLFQSTICQRMRP